MDKVGVGIIGCGDIARVRYLPSIAANEQLELVAIYSRTPESCRPLAEQYGGALYGELDDLLGDPAVEAVIITTPHPSHADLSIRALEAGKHVLVEKPMATSLADAIRVCTAAKQSGRVFMPLPFDDLPPMQEARRLILSGAIGRVSSGDGVLAHDGPVHASWFFDRDKAAWGVLADLGVYLVSQFVYLLGAPDGVCGTVRTVFPRRTLAGGETVDATVEDNVAATLSWPDGTLVSIRANWCSAADKRNFIWELRVYGTEGVIFVNMASPTYPLVVYSPHRPIEAAEAITYNGFTHCYRPTLAKWDHHDSVVSAFADAVSQHRLDDGDAVQERQRQVIEVMDKLYQSSTIGRAAHMGARNELG